MAGAVACLVTRPGLSREIARIGYLSPLTRTTDKVRNDAFRRGLADLGYISGTNIQIEERFADGNVDMLPILARELVDRQVSLIVAAGGTFVAQSAKTVTSTIPIVVTNAEDPTASGLVRSLARPGGNLTGLTTLSSDLSTKRFEVIKDILPNLVRLAILWHPDVPEKATDFAATRSVAEAASVSVLSLEVRGLGDFARMFDLAQSNQAQGMIILQDPLTNTYHGQLASMALANRIPAMFAQRSFVVAGGLASYGPNYADLFRRAATLVHKILNGDDPADIPFEQPTKFEFFLNLKTATSLGLKIPDLAFARADEVIE